MTGRPGALGRARGVFVVGMHSGGTSAVTGALIGLGLAGPVDPPEPSDQHPHGIFESPRVWEFNEHLLARLGTTSRVGMEGVPLPAAGWHDDPGLSDAYDDGARLLASAFPTEPWALKDPRLCVLLPFWRRVVRDTVGAVLVARNPLDAARSYEDWLNPAPADRLAWWEHYMRSAVLDLLGLPVFVTDYDGALADPREWCGTAAAWLRDLGFDVREDGSERGAAFLDAGARKHSTSAEELQAVPESCRSLYALLRQAGGTYASWDPSVVLRLTAEG